MTIDLVTKIVHGGQVSAFFLHTGIGVPCVGDPGTSQETGVEGVTLSAPTRAAQAVVGEFIVPFRSRNVLANRLLTM